MQHPYSMSNNCSHSDAKAHGSTTRELGVCDKIFVGLVLWTLVHSAEALAGDQAPLFGTPAKPDSNDLRQPTPLSALMLPIPAPYQAVELPETKTYSTQEFRPRAHSILNSDSHVAAVDDESMMNRTTVWQRLSEYRSHNRVRLVTLWETGGSSLSLQAGRKGDPSLQWTSRLMNRGGAPRGLLDELFSTSFGGAVGRGLHFAPHATNADPTGKPAKPSDAGVAGAGVSK
jgi:hypothetical protein